MDQILTKHNIAGYIYGETSENEALMIEADMLIDNELYDEISAAKDIKAQLDTLYTSPSNATIDFLLNYSLKETNRIAALN